MHVSLRADDKNYMFVWFVLYVIRIWGTVRFFLMILYKNDDSKAANARYALLILQSIGDPAQGFCNFVMFCILDKIVRKRLCNVFRNICKRNPNEEMRRLLDDWKYSLNEYQYMYIQSLIYLFVDLLIVVSALAFHQPLSAFWMPLLRRRRLI